MATWLGHVIPGVVAGKAAGMGPGGMFLTALVAYSPDIDLLIGLAVEGDTGAFHRAPWSHSPPAALVGGAIVFLGTLVFYRVRGREELLRPAVKYGLLTALLLFSHWLWDYWLVNPFFGEASTRDLNELPNLLRAAGRQLVNFLTDFLIYGAISLAGYVVYRWGQRWYRARRAVGGGHS
ncbi:MAG: hypothetical protein Q8P22_00095 [Chloroflexota bacterium]|nr:hypothetical protein [Chloroflexota bacterium]